MIRLFLSHASEDKDDFVRPLAEALRSDFNVWYDEYKLVGGDSLRRRIDEGLRSCDYGVVVLSHHFFAKHWAQSELDGLFSLETIERKVIIPVWKDVNVDDVRKFSPILADRVGIPADQGVGRVVDEIKRSVVLLDRQRILKEDAWKKGLSSLNADLKHQRHSDELGRSVEGVRRVTKAAREIIAKARARVEALGEELGELDLAVSDNHSNQDRTFIQGAIGTALSLSFTAQNVVKYCKFRIDVFIDSEIQETLELFPKFDRDLEVYWEGGGESYNSSNDLIDYAFSQFESLFRHRFLP